ncbi:hypothetical protein NL478_27075, partial [Klebsiella pneumoniae]|nr:hypothetical protein [Klebsiella pneumoniae]
MSTQHLPLWGHKEVYTLQNIQEEFIPAIFDAFPPPANLPGHLASNLGLFFFCLMLTLDALLGDEGF